ncbi:MAG: hypothetical protein ACLQJF_07010 [Candidatus Sulfotelmatobacter sp.]|jgi:hypothetical protein
MSDFMQRQVTDNENWLQVETRQGTEFIRIADTSLFIRNSDCPSQPLTEGEKLNALRAIRQFVEGEIESWENVKGYGARLSAPGYLDCTEWTVFDTEQEATEFLDEFYPEEESDENEEA